MNWFVYMVQSNDSSLYTGITKDIDARVKKHNSGNGAKALKGKLPVTLVYFEEYETHREAAQREWEIKQLPRDKKLELIKNC